MVVSAEKPSLDEDGLLESAGEVVQYVFLGAEYVFRQVKQLPDNLLSRATAFHTIMAAERERELVLAGLKQALVPLAYSQAEYWWKNAEKEERLGAKVLVEVWNRGGGETLEDLMASKLEESQENPLKSPAGSVYRVEYQGTAKPRSYMELLRYHSLRELPFSVVLQPQAFERVEIWLDLKDNEALVTALLAFLRGIHSVVKVNCVFPNSLQRSCYVWYSKRDFLKAARLKPRAEVGPSLTSISSAVNLTRDSSPVSSSVEFTPQPNHSKPRKQRELLGSTSLLRSQISLPSFHSTYQTTFALHFKRLVKPPPRVAPRSTSLGLCPHD